MKVITGRVVDGRIEVGEELPEGATIAVLADAAGFQLTESEEDELSAALRDVRSGSYVDGASLLAEINALTRR
jgi:hypothetical protein